MKMHLQRLPSTAESTTGKLTTDGRDECHTIEDVCRPAGAKVHGKTAIPAGTYEVRLTMSTRFKKVMPLLLNVPGFAGVRIHAGNTAADTEGCILVGLSTGTNVVYQSRQAYAALYNKIEKALAAKEKVTITIADPPVFTPPAPRAEKPPVPAKKAP